MIHKLKLVFKKLKKPLIIVSFVLPIVFTMFLGHNNNWKISIIIIWVWYLILSLLLGRIYCGYMCITGMIQRFFDLIGDILIKKRIEINEKIDKYLRSIKYIFIILIIVWSIILSKILLMDGIPIRQYSELWDNLGFEKGFLGWTTMAFSISMIIGSIFIKSFYCKYLCLKGSIMGIMSNIGFSRFKIDSNKCTNCGLCTQNCPMNIKLDELKTLKSMDCIRCMQCVAICPPKAIYLKIFGILINPSLLWVLLPVMIIIMVLFLYISTLF